MISIVQKQNYSIDDKGAEANVYEVPSSLLFSSHFVFGLLKKLMIFPFLVGSVTLLLLLCFEIEFGTCMGRLIADDVLVCNPAGVAISVAAASELAVVEVITGGEVMSIDELGPHEEATTIKTNKLITSQKYIFSTTNLLT